ncbi:MAG: alpha/beta hydrolase-fold protein [Dehalococcoidia bacterium]|nr:alpha/beta hydrolase-fold protein [Dehalococcoidia bacterium]
MALAIGPKTPFVLPGTDAYRFHSGVTDRDYEVLITVMASGKPGARYPVLYHPDGDLGQSFPVMVPLMQVTRELPGMIVVSIGYGLGGLVSDPAVLQRWATLRLTDLVPTVQPDGTGGGAPDFLRFISEELMPFVNANYPADADDCGLAGDSLGGLFALYAILASPGMFRRCLAGSPSIERSRDLLFSLEEQLAESGHGLPHQAFHGCGFA